MLNEGIYLHKLIVAAFKEQSKMIYFYLFGWGGPVLVMIPYCIVHSLEAYNKNCWTESMYYPEWIFNGVPIACIFVNKFINIVNHFY